MLARSHSRSLSEYDLEELAGCKRRLPQGPRPRLLLRRWKRSDSTRGLLAPILSYDTGQVSSGRILECHAKMGALAPERPVRVPQWSRPRHRVRTAVPRSNRSVLKHPSRPEHPKAGASLHKRCARHPRAPHTSPCAGTVAATRIGARGPCTGMHAHSVVALGGGGLPHPAVATPA